MALLWNSSSEVEVINYTSWHISASIKHPSDNAPWQLTSFYGHPITSKRHESWRLLHDLRLGNLTHWLCLRDFNEITHQREKYGASYRPFKQMATFRSALNDSDLIDLGFIGDIFTWSNNREGREFTKERLDRACGNTTWIDSFNSYSVALLNCTHSDHGPLFVQIKAQQPTQARRKIFRFESA